MRVPASARLSGSILQFGEALRLGLTSTLEVVDTCLRRIEADNQRHNAFTLVMAHAARERARALDRELAVGIDHGPLHGVPVSIKDLIDIRGEITTAGSRVRDRHVARKSATVISRLHAAGMVVMGKNNLHEFAFGTTSEDSAFGPVHNPYDSRRSAGGSSGGSAVSVATGMAFASIGTDTGGSVRIPASACGVVGLKPSFGEIPVAGVIPLAPTFDHVGPIARTVTDAYLVYRAAAGIPGRAGLTAKRLSAVRLAIPRPYFFDLLDHDVRDRFTEATERLCRRGAQFTNVVMSRTDEIAATFSAIQGTEAYRYHAEWLGTRWERYTEPVRLRLLKGAEVSTADYAAAFRIRERLIREVDAILGSHDAIVLPTLPIAPPVLGSQSVNVNGVDELVRPLMLRLTQLFNITGHPVISIPCGVTTEGLPCGLQLVGRCGATDDLLRVALACESALRDS